MLLALLATIIAGSAVLSAAHGARLIRATQLARPGTIPPLPADVPSVSVCIPARNETHAMAECLERVLASDYPKMEIVLFDDNSADDTSQIIRSFAQAGVRFVAGTGLPEGWLGKNYAQDVLAREASGTYVVFMDVDTIIAPSTIRHVVATAISGNKTMVSVIPERGDGWRLSVLFGHLRYFWELTVNTKANPAVASALWLIHRETLLGELGGISALKLTAAPETALAARLGTAYRCLISSKELEVLYEKKWSSQVETSKRLLYPRAGGTKRGAAVALASLLLLNVPLVALVVGVALDWPFVQIMATLALVTGMLVYGAYTRLMWRHAWFVGALCWPIVVLQELVLFILSVQGYARHTITWKGRPISPSPRVGMPKTL